MSVFHHLWWSQMKQLTDAEGLLQWQSLLSTALTGKSTKHNYIPQVNQQHCPVTKTLTKFHTLPGHTSQIVSSGGHTATTGPMFCGCRHRAVQQPWSWLQANGHGL